MAVLLLVDFNNLAYTSGRRTASPHQLARRVLAKSRTPARLVGATHIAFAADNDRLNPNYAGSLAEMRFPQARTILEGLGYPCYQLAGSSADDLLVSLAIAAEAAGFERVVVLSGDRDLLAAVGGRRDLLKIHHRVGQTRYVRWTPESLSRRYKVTPDQLDDIRVLGTRQIGPRQVPAIIDGRTASALLARHGSVNALYDHLAAVGPAGLRDRLAAMEPEARRRQALLRTRAQLPCVIDMSAGCLGDEVGLAHFEPSFTGYDRVTLLDPRPI